MEVGERLAVIQQHKNEDVVGNETVEEKRGAAVNVVVHVDDEDKGDDRQEVIGSDNTGGGDAKTDGIAEREQEGVVEEGRVIHQHPDSELQHQGPAPRAGGQKVSRNSPDY